MTDHNKGLRASIHQRLLNVSKKHNENFQFTLTHYAIERFLYRFSISEYSEQFVLKGALLLTFWSQERFRPTRDIDMLGLGDISTPVLRKMMTDICRMQIDDDGIEFDAEDTRITDIREDQPFQGKRIRFNAYLGKAKAMIQLDIGYGDLITPKKTVIDYPSVLNMPIAKLQAYPLETVIAEKFQIMVDLGMQNSRMKDIYDLQFIARTFPFSGKDLQSAIRNTFNRRKTLITDKLPLVFTDEFKQDPQKNIQWLAFNNRIGLQDKTNTLDKAIEYLEQFLLSSYLSEARSEIIETEWKAGGPWQ